MVPGSSAIIPRTTGGGLSIGAGGRDRDTVPACSSHHTLGPDAVHRLGVESFDEKFGISQRAIAAAIHQALSKEQAA